ncbi:MAG TPA: hypothetical protein VM513_08935 [Kofleriaceae bacterium]|nr:hypothetical protein [Kofleriaceae bacterium]
MTNDPLRGQRGTLQIEYRAISDGGVRMDATTRTLRMSVEQFVRFQAFIEELANGTPEIHDRDGV